MRFHLVDKIDSWQAHRTITARKVTSAAEDYWDSGRVMPPGLVLETVCQAATWLILLSSALAKRAILLSVNKAAWSRDVSPGDVLSIVATITAHRDDAVLVDGSVGVDGNPVLRAAGILCALRDADTLEAKEDTERMACLLRRGDGAR